MASTISVYKLPTHHKVHSAFTAKFLICNIIIASLRKSTTVQGLQRLYMLGHCTINCCKQQNTEY